MKHEIKVGQVWHYILTNAYIKIREINENVIFYFSLERNSWKESPYTYNLIIFEGYVKDRKYELLYDSYNKEIEDDLLFLF